MKPGRHFCFLNEHFVYLSTTYAFSSHTHKNLPSLIVLETMVTCSFNCTLWRVDTRNNCTFFYFYFGKKTAGSSKVLEMTINN